MKAERSPWMLTAQPVSLRNSPLRCWVKAAQVNGWPFAFCNKKKKLYIYIPGVLKTVPKCYLESGRDHGHRPWSRLAWCSNFWGGGCVTGSVARLYRKGANSPPLPGVPPLKCRGVGWVRIWQTLCFLLKFRVTEFRY